MKWITFWMLLFGMLLSTVQILQAQKPHNLHDGFLQELAQEHDLLPSDISDYILKDEHTSKQSGVHHLYYRQQYQGIEIYGANASLHILPNGKLLTAHQQFIQDLNNKITGMTQPVISPVEAVLAAAQAEGYLITNPLVILENIGGASQEVVLSSGGISRVEIPVKLIYQPVDDETIRLAWDLSIHQMDGQNWWSIRVDASDGTILHKDNWVVSCNLASSHSGHVCGKKESVHSEHETKKESASEFYKKTFMPFLAGSYQVYAMPVESPNFGDRTIETDPEDAIASPFGWHDTNGVLGAEYTVTRGNNVHAYEDGNNSGYNPNGGGALNFTFPLDTNYSSGNESEDAAITNLFYWNNIIHDVWYQYGFDEASGNFQENNYGKGGAGSDYVYAEAQDGSGTCNANFGTPSDGNNPTMQMYVCGDRDGDLDNVVIVHEYGHGISNRLTGGPGSSGCLGNQEQMGEGWSDWFGLMMTIEPGDTESDFRTIGTWLFEEGATGDGIREFPYTTDMNVNTHTYDRIKTASVPHGVGSVWAEMLWEMTWGIIEQDGFDPDFYNGTGGNNVAMALVIEGLKLQSCSPGFVDGRDAILAADQALYGGAYNCIIWEAFAKRGLGFSADQGSSGSRGDGTEAFDIHPNCDIPKITFESDNHKLAEGDAPETPSAANDCRPYTDHNIGVILTSSANGDPIVQVGLTGGSATLNTDFELMNTTLVFTSPDTQYVTLRVFNDANVESLESISLDLTISNSGSTDAILGNFSNQTIDVYDNEIPPGGLVSTVLKSSNYEVNEEGYTSQNSGGDDWMLGDEADASSQFWTVPSNGSQSFFFVNDDECNCNMSNVKLISPSLDFSNLQSASVTFNTFFEGNTYAGDTETADLEVSLNGGSFTNVQNIAGVTGAWQTVAIDLTSYIGNSDVRIAFKYNDDGGWLYGFTIDDVVVEGTVNFEPEVASELNSSDEQDLTSGAEVYFFAGQLLQGQQKLLGKLNNGSFDFECMNVNIDREGFESTAFWNNEPENYLMDKTFEFLPEFNDKNASYTITLYFSAAEVDGWEIATGKVFLQDAKIVKSPSPIGSITPSNPNPPSGEIEIAEVVIVGQLPYSQDYFITATFNTGFSYFGVGDPGVLVPLPVELIKFSGEHIQNSGNYLEWSTATETHNDYFELEQSSDGIDFKTIAKLEGAGTSDVTNFYEFLDRDYIVGKNYYRLRQVDTDGKFSFSDIIVIDVEGTTTRVDVFPNPAKEELNIVFQKEITDNLQIKVVDVLGKKWKDENVGLSGSSQFKLDISNLPNGVYFAEMRGGEGASYQFKFVVNQ